MRGFRPAAAPRLDPRPRRSSRGRTAIRLGGILLVPLVALATGCRPAASARPDIYLVVLDTLRRDRLATYGYERPTSPHFDAFAATGRRYDNAYATGGWTTPSHASLFSGLYAIRHGATQEHWALDAGWTTLAELLSEAGYETVGVTGNPMIARKRGFSQGFDVYHESWRAPLRRDRDPLTVAWVEQFLAERSRERPLFLFVNLIGPHSPFDSCGSSCGAFGADVDGGIVDSQWRDYYVGDRAFSEAEFDRLGRLYDAEVLEADVHLGRILEAIDRHSPRGDTLVVVTSDHGENLGDHGHVNHVFSLYESTIRVPLVIRRIGRIEAGSRETRGVQLVDLFPTILRAAGLDAVAVGSQGRDLLASTLDDRAIFVEYYRPDQAMRRLLENVDARKRKKLAPYQRRIKVVIDDGWKLIWGSDGRHELYDLRSDPNETRNRIDDPAARARRAALLQQVRTLVASYRGPKRARPTAEPEPLAAQTQEELRALGYTD